MNEQQKVTVDAQCEACRGSGLYVGIGERDGLAVVCRECRGSGMRPVTYTPFTGLRLRHDVRKVVQNNPGVVLIPELTRGGVGYQEWLERPESAREMGREVREFYCPAWWHLGAGSGLMPQWEECIKFGSFPACPSFEEKERCWERHDAERIAGLGE